MVKDFEGFSVFHCYPHAFGNVRLFKDFEDKLFYLLLIAKYCIENSMNILVELDAFEILNYHAHFLITILWPESTNPGLDWLDRKTCTLIKNINRDYGKYYRKKYKYSGKLFLRNKKNFTNIPHRGAYLNALKYIHNNGTFSGVFRVFEDNVFNSYNFFLAAFVHNSEVQTLPNIQTIITDPAFLPVFNALNLDRTIKFFNSDRTYRKGIETFYSQHQNLLLERDIKRSDYNSRKRYETLNLSNLVDNPSNLQIFKTKGHKVKRFIDNISQLEVTRKNSEFLFHAFTELFNLDSMSLYESFRIIRKDYGKEFEDFVVEMRNEVPINLISRLTGIHRNTIAK